MSWKLKTAGGSKSKAGATPSSSGASASTASSSSAPTPKAAPSSTPTPKAASSSSPLPKSAAVAPPTTVHGKHLQKAEKAARSNDLSKFNHTGRPLRAPLSSMAKGTSITSTQFRDAAEPSPEFPGGIGRGRHEIASTSKRAPLVGNPVGTAVAAAARTNTGFSALKEPSTGEVTAHTGLMTAGMSTTGQSASHAPFHAFPPTLAAQSDPFVASALAMDVALQGLPTPRDIRGSKSLTGATWAGGTGKKMEKPDLSRGLDDGYDSDTERGKFARRLSLGREQLKEGLNHVRSQSKAAAAATRAPSPPRSRGGMGKRSGADREPLKPPIPNKKAKKEEVAKDMTEFAFAGYQSLK